MKKLISLIVFLALIAGCSKYDKSSHTIPSPDKKIEVAFAITASGEPVYTVAYSDKIILRQSKLGIVRSDGDFSAGMTLDSVSEVVPVSDNYTMLHGKKLKCSYNANRRVLYLKNSDSKLMEVIFQVSDDGVAFRYYFPGETDTVFKIIKELSSWHFNPSAKAFIQPCADARMGWNYSSPSYEEHYQIDIPVGTPAPFEAGWVMPALFSDGNIWISITETAVDTNYCGSRLSQYSRDGEYSVHFPQPQEGRAGEPVLPQSILPWHTPWRIIAIADDLAGLVESNLETDLSIPSRYDVSEWLQPGIASWSWVILKDGATVYNVQKQFIDFAADMNWEYCLIDAFWDTQIGYEKIKQLADYAKTKNIKLILWYNSAGDWNTTPLSPRDKMLTPQSRSLEFGKLRDMGIAGIKVDFFGGDGQSMMKYYADILKDAAKYHIAVNFHGCTFPRGWARTYPNLVSMESIKGEEYVTFGQYDADRQAKHCTVIPFTRNLFDPMDFTPVNFSGIPNVLRRTTDGFEIALSVIFTSGIQHIAEIPEGMEKQPDFVKEFMRALPERWEDVKFIDGYPGKFVVLARKSNDTWYIAGINGEDSVKKITPDISFLHNNSRISLITDSDNGKLSEQEIIKSGPVEITLQPQGGFVIKASVTEINQ